MPFKTSPIHGKPGFRARASYLQSEHIPWKINKAVFTIWPDSEVLAGLSRLHLVERATQAEFLIYLNEVEDRMLFAAEGYSSVFSFLVEFFHYSEAIALKRIQVARLGRKFPEVYECQIGIHRGPGLCG